MHIDDLYCPITPQINPHYERVRERSMEWAVGHRLISESTCEDTFDRLRIPEFVARSYPHASAADLRVVTDWTIWGFLADDEHDKLAHKPDLLRGRFLEHLEVLQNDVYDHVRGSHLALADLRSRILERSQPRCLQRFVYRASEWFESMHWEAMNRSRNASPGVEEYLRAREITVGMYTEYALFDVTHQVDTPEGLWLDPDLRRLMVMAANIIGWSNDLFSYRKEREIGDPHNLVLLLVAQNELEEKAACKTVLDMHNLEMLRFLELAEATQRRRAGRDSTTEAFIQMLRCWIRGNVDWAYSTHRYGLHAASTGVRAHRAAPEWSQPGIAA